MGKSTKTNEEGHEEGQPALNSHLIKAETGSSSMHTLRGSLAFVRARSGGQRQGGVAPCRLFPSEIIHMRENALIET